MKLYTFYFKNDGTIRNGYSVYAFTKNKKMYKLFKNTRNMDAFRVQIQNVSKKEFIDFKNEHNNDELNMYNFDKFNRKTWRYENVKFLTTSYEHDMVKDIADSCFYSMDFDECGISQDNGNMNIFVLKIEHLYMIKRKYRDVLNKIFYFQLYDSVTDRENFQYESSFSVDEVNIFIEIFKNTLKISEGKDNDE